MTVVTFRDFHGADRVSAPANRRLGSCEACREASFIEGTLAPVGYDALESSVEVVGNINENARYLDVWWNGNEYQWVSWPDTGSRVDFVEGVVVEDIFDRGYWTGSGGEGLPRMASRNEALGSGEIAPRQSYLLGIPALKDAISVPADIQADEDETAISTAWVHTLVSVFGEEGPPSPPSLVTTINDGQRVELGIPAVPASVTEDRNISKRRIYRANTGSSATTYQFVTELDISATSYEDTVPSHLLAESIPSEDWHPPPDSLLGLTAVGGGVLAGFDGDTIWFSERHLPHAWPKTYAIGLDAPIVRLATLAQGLVVLTRGKPYLVTGVDPATMAPAQIDFPQACVNPNSVVNMGHSIWYCAPDGLASISASGAEVITRKIISPREWRARYATETCLSFFWEGRYVALLDADLEDAGSESGRAKTGFVFDIERGICDLDWSCTGGYASAVDGSLRLLGLER